MATPKGLPTVDTYKVKDVQWLWKERIPRGMLTVIGGKKGGGKSLIAAHIAADVTKAGGRVLYSAIEDSTEIITKPRLIAAGAVEKRLIPWTAYVPQRMNELRDIVKAEKIDLIVIDPLAPHLTDGVKRANDNIREVTTPLAKIAEEHNLAVIIIEHTLKHVAPSADPVTAIGGSSSGLVAAGRMIFLFGEDPDMEDQRVLANIGATVRERADAMFFETDTIEVDGLIRPVPFMVLDKEGVFDPIRLVTKQSSSNGKMGRPAVKLEEAAEWLTKYMFAKGGGPLKASVIIEDAKHSALTPKTLTRAAIKMGVERLPVGGRGKNVTWTLPSDLMELIADANGSAEQPAEPALPVEAVVVAEIPDPEPDKDEDNDDSIISDEDIAGLIGKEGE